MTENVSEFDELDYFELNPDVEAAVLAGAFSSGYEHWERHGRAEGRLVAPPPAPSNAPRNWSERAYLRANPDVAAAVRSGGFANGFEHWNAYGEQEARPGGPAAFMKTPPTEALQDKPFGFNCFGYGLAPTGLGSAMRSYVDLFRSLTPNVATIRVPLWGTEQPGPDVAADGAHPYACNVILQNPDVLPCFLSRYGRRILNGRINIASWVWELHAGYPAWRRLSRLFHEVWVPTRYVAESLTSISTVPLAVIAYPVDGLPPRSTLTRASLGLPDHAFTFLYVFDIASTIARKNPLTLIRAFHRAFGERPDVRLVLKYHNTASDPAGAATLERLAGPLPNVHVFSETMGQEELYSLFQITDCFVSPHRSEGFGFNIAAAMYYGKPVIATGYSGNMDFMDGNTAFPIDYDLVPVGPGQPHYRENYAWAEPSSEHLESLLKDVVEHRDHARAVGAAGQAFIRANYSTQAISRNVEERIAGLTART